ncbi:hypothetical protein JCM33374_g281 [Metschnikowia sp. JCM 33374]|nr:hypothetical protein JCM33374_g281 [Metschnikowia sp. JCM 33374]
MSSSALTKESDSTSLVNIPSSNISSINKRMHEAGSDKSEYIKVLVQFLIANNLPFYTISSPRFKILTAYPMDHFQAPITFTDLRLEIDSLYTKEIDSLKQQLESNNGKFALSIDEYNAGTDYSFFVITVHYYNHDFKLENHIIGFEVLENKLLYKGEHIRGIVQKVLQEFSIAGRIIGMARANSGPFQTLLNSSLDQKYFTLRGLDKTGKIPCMRHVFDEAMGVFLDYTFFKKQKKNILECFKDIEEKNPESSALSLSMRSLPTTIRNIIKQLCTDRSLNIQFQRIAHWDNPRELTDLGAEILEDKDISYSSIYKIIDQFIDFEREINQLLNYAKKASETTKEQSNLEVDEITFAEWSYLTKVRDILKALRNPIVKAQAFTRPTANLIIPTVHRTLKKLEGFMGNKNPYLAMGLTEASKKILEYYPLQDDMDKMRNIYLATALDPRFKLELFKDLKFPESVIEEIQTSFFDVYQEYERIYEYEMENRQMEKRNAQARKYKQEISSWALEDGVYSKYFSSDARRSTHEAKAYLLGKREPGDTNVHVFYKMREFVYPVIYRMAKDYLAIPASSKSAERLFSDVKNMVSVNGNGLHPDLIEKLAILKARGVITDERGDFKNKSTEEMEKEDKKRPKYVIISDEDEKK